MSADNAIRTNCCTCRTISSSDGDRFRFPPNNRFGAKRRTSEKYAGCAITLTAINTGSPARIVLAC